MKIEFTTGRSLWIVSIDRKWGEIALSFVSLYQCVCFLLIPKNFIAWWNRERQAINLRLRSGPD